jgi:FkbM family methyltransferase
MTSREMIEFMSKGGAGIISETTDYYWTHVLNRFDMYVSKTDKSVSPHLIQDGFWESWITKWVIDNVNEDTFFIDIGANTGYYSFLANDLGAQVYAFEPNPEYFDMMFATCSRANTKNVYLSNIALSDYHGEAVLHIPLELHGSASLTDIPNYDTNKVTVSVRPLDDRVTHYPQTHLVIKIDAEGEEERIMRGAKNLIDNAESVVVLLEYTPNAYSSDFVDFLFDNFHVSFVDGAGNEERAFVPWLESQTDWVMLVLR